MEQELHKVYHENISDENPFSSNFNAWLIKSDSTTGTQFQTHFDFTAVRCQKESRWSVDAG